MLTVLSTLMNQQMQVQEMGVLQQLLQEYLSYSLKRWQPSKQREDHSPALTRRR